MLKRFTLLLLLLLLAACGGTTVEQDTDDSTSPAAADSSDTEIEAEVTTINPETVVEVVDGPFPATSVAEAAVVRNRDHTKGAVNPDVVIIEYGDFQ